MAEDGEIAITIVEDADANVAAAEVPVVKEAPSISPDKPKDPALADLMAQYKELETKSAEIERRAQNAETRRQTAEQEAALHRQKAETSRRRETCRLVADIAICGRRY
jgi:hypothetical protein